MTIASPSAFSPLAGAAPGAEAAARASAPRCLDTIARGVPVAIVAFALEPEVVRWLEAVGISLGEELVVLRRAAFGGPIHVRTSAGGEFALALSLAGSIEVRDP